VANKLAVDVLGVEMPDTGKNKAMLNRTLLHTVTPYEVTLNIDADTIIKRNPSRMFGWAKEFEFVVCNFCDWTSKSGKMQKRIREILTDNSALKDAYEFGPALNCGVYSFTKNSEWMDNWYKLASPHRQVFICDEKTCQAYINKYPHFIADQRFNCSSVHAEINDSTHIIHFHGKKHCRVDGDKYRYNSDIWYDYFDEIRENDFIVNNIQHDRQLRNNLSKHDALTNEISRANNA